MPTLFEIEVVRPSSETRKKSLWTELLCSQMQRLSAFFITPKTWTLEDQVGPVPDVISNSWVSLSDLRIGLPLWMNVSEPS